MKSGTSMNRKQLLLFVWALLFLSPFFWSYTSPDNRENRCSRPENGITLSPLTNPDSVRLTYNGCDVKSLPYLGIIKVKETRWFHTKSELKKETIGEMKKKAAELGGNIIYISPNEMRGYGICVSSDINGYVYKK